ncbi:DNA polymerase I [Candidatus Poribacteria bacterium]|nr:DNA polymerase I [Candidatus Poribacteria bacterium]MYK20914.1 DNA polymerase I [Candidatus Poribacteria bacterium]
MQNEQKDTVYIIDTHAEIFRAYYAIRGGLTSSVTGEATHAVFGFVGTLIRILMELEAKYIVAAIDTPGDTFRNELYSAYKANRSPVPDDLVTQIHRILQLLEAFGILTLGKPELEADDIIASVTQAILDDPNAKDVDVSIISRDKDLEQLLGDRVTMLDLHNDKIIDERSLWETKGIKPDQVIDALTLMGDTSDNVPGVEKIGLKTAAQLIQQYGSIDGIFENIDKIKGKRRENLEKARSQLPLSKQLVTLIRDADLDFSLEQARVKPLDLQKIRPLLQELELKRYEQVVTKLAGGDTESVAAPATRKERVAELAQKTDAILDKGNYDTAEAGNYSAIVTLDELNTLVKTLSAQEIICFDTETDGLDREAKLCGLSFSWKPKQGVYVPVRSPQPESHLDADTVLAALKPILENPVLPKCGHNLKFDTSILIRNGVKLQGVVFDTLLASQLVDARTPSHNLDTLALLHLGHKMISFEELTADPSDATPTDAAAEPGGLFEAENTRQKTIDEVPLKQSTVYAAEDADITLRLYHFLTPKLEELGITELVREIESPLAPILAEMEYNGIVCDRAELKRQSGVIEKLVDARQKEIHKIVGYPFNIDSPSQLVQVLFEELGFKPVKRTRGGKISTDVTVLEALSLREDVNDPQTSVPRLIIDYRQYRKLQSTYLAQLRSAINERTDRIHTHLYQLTTATGRLKSDGPNLQNIPVRTEIGRQLRRAFRAPEGHKLICADYSQIELRILAHFSEDESLIETFTQDLDIHTAVASQVFEVPTESVTRELRDKAKTINFGIIYGVSATGLSRRIKGMRVKEAAALIDDYKTRFPGIDRFLQQCVQQALDHGYVRTLTGRRRAIPEIYSTNRSRRSLGERLAINTVVQGSAADLMKAAMVHVQHRIDADKLPLKMLLQIHDELVLETPEGLAAEQAEIVCAEMENAMSLRVPLRTEAGIGDNWMTAK